MTDNKKNQNKKPDVPKWTAPKIEEIPRKWDWKDTGLDTFVLFAIATFTKGLNAFGEEKHFITAWQVNPTSDKVMSEQQYIFESNSKTVKFQFENYFKDWQSGMEGTRMWMHMSSNQTEGLYIVKAE